MNTLKYCYQNNNSNGSNAANAMDTVQRLLCTPDMGGGIIVPISRPSVNGLDRTFQVMLDEGDSAEGGLNLRSRNQQWKDCRCFRNKFKSENPLVS